MRRRRLCALAAVLLPLALPIGAEAHRGAWESHSVRQAGGNAAARTFAGCERIEAKRDEHFSKHRCKHKAYWNREYRRLSADARRWLAITGGCETRGYDRYFASYGVDTHNGFWARYQFAPSTADSAGFTVYLPRGYYREQDVRTWRWRWNPASSGAAEWPNCSAW